MSMKQSVTRGETTISHARRGVRLAISGLLLGAALASNLVLACTAFVIPTSDGAWVYGRTMEFAAPIKSSAIVIPRQYSLTASLSGSPGTALAWKSKYAAVGMNAFGLSTIIDGMNEKGLTGGALYFPGYADYAKQSAADPHRSLAPWDFITWALTNFSSVAEVKAALHDISVVDVVQKDMGITPPVHYQLHDASGASIVIEPLGGTLKVYDNPIGVLTNSPPFAWHITNLSNYLKLSSTNAPTRDIAGQKISPLGQGSGLLGVPGDPTPPSRFVRAIGYTMSVQRLPSGIGSVRMAEHIANNFDIPKGWIRDGDSKGPLEYTQWTSIADIKNRRYYIKGYDDQVLRSIDLMSFDLNAKSIVMAPVPPMNPTALPFGETGH